MNFEKLKDFLDYSLPMLGVPGSDTVIYKDHEPVFRYQSGYDSLRFGTPVRDNALYNIYSCTKVATCVAAMQLVERGDLLVDDPLCVYFPEFTDMQVLGADGGLTKAKEPIRIKHLFSMTSGLDYNPDTPAIKRVIEQTDGRAPTLDIVGAIADRPLLFEPGTAYRYGLSHDVLGGVVELVSGMKLGDYMKENIFDPLGMTRTSFDRSDERISCLATQYTYDKTAGAPVEIGPGIRFALGSEYQSGGAGLISCVDDYVLLADALAHMGVGRSGERILSSFGVELLRSPIVPQEMFRKGNKCVQHRGYAYGYGVRVNVDPASVGNLTPKGAFGWDGAKLSIFSADPANKIAIFHAEHIDGLHAMVMPRFFNAVYACLDED